MQTKQIDYDTYQAIRRTTIREVKYLLFHLGYKEAVVMLAKANLGGRDDVLSWPSAVEGTDEQ